MRGVMVWSVASKEFLSTLRDRRAIISNLLIPFLILPVVMLGLPFVLGGLFQREAVTVSEVGVRGLDAMPDALREQLGAENLTPVEATDPAAAVTAGTYQAALELPDDLGARLAAGEAARVTVYARAGNLRSDLTANRLRSAVTAYQQEIVTQRLEAAGLGREVLEPVTVNTIDATPQTERSGGALSWLIPFFIAIWTLTGGQMAAIDATAGEKERGTLEILLVSPVRRSEVVVGKFLATTAFGLAAAVMAILGYVLGGRVVRGLFAGQLGDAAEGIEALIGGSLNTEPLAVLMLVVSSLLLAGLVAALLIGVAMFARSFKEAQSYIAPLSFLMIIPAISLQLADFFTANPLLSLVPILNVLLLMDAVTKGTATLTQALLTWGSTLVYTALLLDFAYRSFRREGVLFRT